MDRSNDTICTEAVLDPVTDTAAAPPVPPSQAPGAAPVVEEKDRLLGVITVDDVLESSVAHNWRCREPAAHPDVTGVQTSTEPETLTEPPLPDRSAATRAGHGGAFAPSTRPPLTRADAAGSSR